MNKIARPWMFAVTLFVTTMGILLAFNWTASAAGPRVVSVMGIKQSAQYRTIIHIRLEVPAGADPDVIAGEALRAFGAHTIGPADLSDPKFFVLGAVWSQFFNHGKGDDTVVQYYNPAGDPTGGSGLPLLLNSQATWNGVRSTRFRFEFGGTTTRTPIGADQFNDVAWLPPPADISHRALAVTLSTFDIVTGHFIDADVLINPFFRWATDGSDYDLETILVHEEGHVLGLDHSLDPTSVMFGPYVGVVRSLAQADVDGASFLYPRKRVKPVPRQDPPALYTLVASLDDPIPSRMALLSDQFEPGGLNARGDVAFVSSLVGRCTPSDCIPAEGQGVFLVRKGVMTQVARNPQKAPGDPIGRTLNIGTLGRAALNDKGDMAFSFDLTGYSVFPPFGDGAGLYSYDAQKKTLGAVVVPYETPATGCVFSGPSSTPCLFFGSLEPAINDQGEIAFTGVIPSETGNYGVFVAGRKGKIVKVVAAGDRGPEGTFDYVSSPSIDNAGDVAFDGHLVGEECIFSPDVDCPSSVYFWHSASGRIQAIARMGAPAPGGGTFRFAVNPVLNNHKDILFAGDLTAAPGLLSNLGLFLFTDGCLVPVVRPGDPLPGGGHLVRTSVKIGFGWPEYWLSDNGHVAFTATLDTDSDDDGLFDTGVYLWERGAIRLVARTGTIVPGEGVIAHLQPPVRVGFPQSRGGAMVNDLGHVLFQATLTNGRGVLLVADPPATWPQITTMTPASVTAGTTTTVVMSGSDIEKTTAVLVFPPDGVTTTIDSTTPNSVTARITVAANARSGERQIGVLTTSATSNALTFQIIPLPPRLDSVDPSGFGQGGGGFVLVSGANLGEVFDLRISPGEGITITDLAAFSDTEVSAFISVAANAVPGPRQLVVFNGAGASNPIAFTISIPLPPHIDYVAPSGAGPGGSPFLFVHGTNLGAVFELRISPADGITISNFGVFSDTEVYARVTVAPGAAPGPRQVIVINAAGSSNPATFTVIGAAP